MKKAHRLLLRLIGGLLSVWMGGHLVGCDGGSLGEEGMDEVDVGQETKPLELTDGQNDLSLNLATPGDVYITSFTEKYLSVGQFDHAVYFYQPDFTSEPIRIALRAEDGMGNTDYGSSFHQVRLISRPGASDETTTPLFDIWGENVYEIPVSRGGWYVLEFQFMNGGPDRTLRFEAYDLADNPLKTMWIAPAGASADVSATVAVETPAGAYFKGGTYGDTSPSHHAYCDNVTVDGNLLYRRGFDQGLFDYPLGQLAPGTHTLDFELRIDGASNTWFGVSEDSFDPEGIKTSWDAVQFLYQGPMHTADYDAWSEGVAFAQDADIAVGVRPPPVRHATDMVVACEDAGLDLQDATLKIYPLGSSVPVYSSDDTADAALFAKLYDYTGGYYAPSGYTALSREHWRVTVPADLPVGRYLLEATAGGALIGEEVVFYVVHNPYASVAAGVLTKQELETYAYDEDEDGLVWNRSSQGTDADADHLRDNFTLIVGNANLDEDGQPILEDQSVWLTRTNAIHRNPGEPDDYSLLDYAMASADGTTTEFESMVRLLRFLNQRQRYNNKGQDLEDASDVVGAFAGGDPDAILSLAPFCSQPGNDTPAGFEGTGAVCYNYARALASLGRSVGIPARAINGGSHAITEAHMPNLPLHGGRLENDPASPPADTDHWYVFDATDHPSQPTIDDPRTEEQILREHAIYNFGTTWENVAPRGQYCMAQKILGGWNPPFVQCVWSTTAVDWELTFDEMNGYYLDSTKIDILAPEFNAHTDFWITGEDVLGWLAFGGKDVYKIDKAMVNEEYIRVTVEPSSTSALMPKMCIVPAPLQINGISNLRHRCNDAASVRRIPDGQSYVVVFNDSNVLRQYHGDVVQYRIEEGDGAGWETCDDGIQNGQETGVDCGGNCAGCDAGAPCEITFDCSSLTCDPGSDVCLPGSCDDDVQNGDEAEIDCGGSCDACEVGTSCTYDFDCASDYCAAGTCQVLNGVPLPARIEAEDYDRYYDTTPGNAGGDCDTGDSVDKEITGDAAGGGCNVGWTTAGEWLEYDVTVPMRHKYDISVRVASEFAGRSLRVEIDGVDVTGALQVPQGGWQTYQDVGVENVLMEAGDHVVRLFIITDYININYLDFEISGLDPVCGDGVCDLSETCDSCAADCGPCEGCTCPSGCNALVSASVPFLVEGAADTCYFFSGGLGSHINSWEMDQVTLNGTDITNIWVAEESYPAPMEGGYYLYYSGDHSWSHVEVM